MIERILRGVFPYDEHGDAIGRSVLIVKPSMFSPETTVNIGWTTDAQDGYEISGFPEERPFLPLPQTLAIVRKSDLDAANARIAALEAENAVLKQAAGAMQRLEALPVDRYGELFIGRNDVGRWNCIVYENLTHGSELVLGTVADEYADNLAAAIDAALAQVEGENDD